MPLYKCLRCGKEFDKKYNYDRHLRRKIACPLSSNFTKLTEPTDKSFVCNQCNQAFTRLYNLQRHQKLKCNIDIQSQTNDNDNQTNSNLNKDNPNKDHLNHDKHNNKSCIAHTIPSEMNNVSYEAFMSLREEVERLKNKSSIINNQNILQVLCVKSDDNYLDLLTNQMGDFRQALEFIKDCALSSLTGDCKLLEKIYFNSNSDDNVPIKYLDKNRTNIEYLNDLHERVVDFKGVKLCRILANNLQNSYLKGVNYLINKNSTIQNKFLDEYDVQSWNAHIYQLSDPKYQKKIISQLDIPTS